MVSRGCYTSVIGILSRSCNYSDNPQWAVFSAAGTTCASVVVPRELFAAESRMLVLPVWYRGKSQYGFHSSCRSSECKGNRILPVKTGDTEKADFTVWILVNCELSARKYGVFQSDSETFEQADSIHINPPPRTC